MPSIIIWSLIVSVFCLDGLNGNKCLKSDVVLQYTECDERGHRWLVSVPKRNQTCDSTSEFSVPRPARNCGEPCLPGTYLDLESQECKDCPAGTYSQGNTIEISNWLHLPPGFSTSSTNSEGYYCNSENWIPNSDYIYVTVGDCESSLSLATSLTEEGEMQFSYQILDEDTIFTLKIINDECQSKPKDRGTSDNAIYMEFVSGTSWTPYSMKLKKGANKISWSVTSGGSKQITVKLKQLKITNTISTTQCNNCSAGYYSGKKSVICLPCPMNQFSSDEATQICKSCPPEQYSLVGAKSCIQKSKCTEDDYSYRWSKCNGLNQRKKTYYWLEPKFCSEITAGAVKLPVESKMLQCGSCPKGTFLNPSSQQCQFCTSGVMAPTKGSNCTLCAHNTKPVLDIRFDSWYNTLPNMTALCVDPKDCNIDDMWLFNGDHLQSSLISNNHILQLRFRTNDQKESSKLSKRSSISFEFSMNCSGICSLDLFIKNDNSATSRVDMWFNSTSRIKTEYELTRNSLVNVMWFFYCPNELLPTMKLKDHIKIYSIEVTDVKDVGAVNCQNCDPKLLNTGCVECQNGKYFSKDSNQCESCPANYVLKKYPGKSIKDCVPCGQGLSSRDGKTCFPYWMYVSPMNVVYDLSKLKGYLLLKGHKLFNTHGRQYTHVFNITMFSADNHTRSFCQNNVSKDSTSEVSSPMCRITVLSDNSKNGSVYSIQAMSIAESFQSLEQSNASFSYWKKINDSLVNNGFLGDNSGLDLHVHMLSDRKTAVCTKGRQTIVTIRCDKTVPEYQFLLPPTCAVETCDGCNFHFLILSRHGCPHCRLDDFNILKEECVNGHQKVHFQEPSFCIPRPGWKVTKRNICPLVTIRTAIVVIPTICILIFLICLVIYCYKKNKNLQYKYMSLVGSNDDHEQIITGAESCGVSDDDEDDDIKVKTSIKSEKMFAKFKKGRGGRLNKDGMETVNLNGSSEFDI